MRQLISATAIFFVSASILGASCKNSENCCTDAGTDTNDKQPLDCSEVSCWKPPDNTCATENTLQVFAPSGYCNDGECIYDSWQEQCNSGLCEKGECITAPCQGMICIDPPEPVCTDANRTIYAPSGYCSGGECSYASKTSACEYACEFGACTDSPCAEEFCRKPPTSYCEDDTSLLVFLTQGRCVVVGGSSECQYEHQTIECQNGCKGGRCLDNRCAGMTCDRPPARYCDGSELVLFNPRGVCSDDGFCTYAEQRRSCIEPCVDAHCGEDEACDNVICNEPPASHCHDDDTLRVYDRNGFCEDGFCSYIYSDLNCPEVCEDGHCKKDPCLGMSCDTPPAAYCNGIALVEFEQKGTCSEGICSYQKKETNCQSSCVNGSCVDVDSLKENFEISTVAQDFTI